MTCFPCLFSSLESHFNAARDRNNNNYSITSPGTVAADGIDAEKEGPPAPNHPPDGLREDQEPDADPKAPVPSVRLESESVEKETSELAEGTTLPTDELGEEKSDIDAAS